MAELNFTISVNNQQVMRKLAEIQSEMRRTAKVAEESGTGLDKFADKLGRLWAWLSAQKNLCKILSRYAESFSNSMSHSEQCSAVRRKLML